MLGRGIAWLKTASKTRTEQVSSENRCHISFSAPYPAAKKKPRAVAYPISRTLHWIGCNTNACLMSLAKALALLCCAFSLFVQVAAHAAAVPQPQSAGMDCAEMMQAMPQHQMDDQDNRSDVQECCPDMSLDCLVAMHCLSPLALTPPPQSSFMA